MAQLIAIDNGHGLNTAGKRTPHFTDGTKSPRTGKSFMHEWEFNHPTAKYLEAELKRSGFRTIQLSDTTADTPLMTRVATANNAKADFLVSIHANALTGKWNAARGIETLTYGSGEGLRIGRLVNDELVKATGLYNRGMKDGKWLALVNYTKMPAILVECGFMDNLSEAKLLLQEAYRKKCAVAIAKGICKGFGRTYVPEKGTSPSKPAPTPKPAASPAFNGSVVDYLNAQGQDASFANRKKLAGAHGIPNYTGTASQNTALLAALQKPKEVKPVTPPKPAPKKQDGKFSDVSKNNGAFGALEHLASIGVANGYPDGTYKPEESITRGQVAILISRAIKHLEGK